MLYLPIIAVISLRGARAVMMVGPGEAAAAGFDWQLRFAFMDAVVQQFCLWDGRVQV